MDKEFNAVKVTNDIIQWIKDWFEENGKDCKAVVGISGGKDSTIVAALCVEALGKDRVYGVLMPNGVQKDIDIAMNVCKLLDIDCEIYNIGRAVNEIVQEVRKGLNGEWSQRSAINLPPRVRMATLYAIAQTVNGMVANTCNLSEGWVGYSTKNGDDRGDFGPLRDLTVTELKKVGYVLKKIPKEYIEKIPTDGLCGKTDEENLGFSYDILDKYIRTGECEDAEIKARIDFLHLKNAFKQKPMPYFKLCME